MNKVDYFLKTVPYLNNGITPQNIERLAKIYEVSPSWLQLSIWLATIGIEPSKNFRLN